MALFDKIGQNALFISPFDHFMSASALHQQRQGRYYWGIMGSVTQIDRKFAFRSIVYYGSGINNVGHVEHLLLRCNNLTFVVY